MVYLYYLITICATVELLFNDAFNTILLIFISASNTW